MRRPKRELKGPVAYLVSLLLFNGLQVISGVSRIFVAPKNAQILFTPKFRPKSI